MNLSFFFLLQLTKIILINLEIECAIFYFSGKQMHILKKLSSYKPNSIKNEGQITIYPHVVWSKFKLPACGLKYDILPT